MSIDLFDYSLPPAEQILGFHFLRHYLETSRHQPLTGRKTIQLSLPTLESQGQHQKIANNLYFSPHQENQSRNSKVASEALIVIKSRLLRIAGGDCSDWQAMIVDYRSLQSLISFVYESKGRFSSCVLSY